jgi:hypothetical protein
LNWSYSGSVSIPKPKLGAPPVLIASPSGFRIFVFVSSRMLPVARPTSGTARTVSRRAASTGGAGAASPSIEMSGPWPCTTASVPARDSVKRFENALSIVSVRTYVPLIIATPRTIAMPVRAARSFRVRSPRSAKPVTGRASPSPR